MAGLGDKGAEDGEGVTMTLRFVPRGRPGIPNSTIRYSDLHSSLKEKIAETDPTEHELLEMIIITLKKINDHMYEITDEELTVGDIHGFR